MYDDPDKQATYRDILDFSNEQLIWRVIYAIDAFHDSPALPAVRNKMQKMCQQAGTRLLSTNHTPLDQELAQYLSQCTEAYMCYIDSLAAKDGEAAAKKRSWLEVRKQIIRLIAQLAPGSADIWKAMLNHETDLLERVVLDIQMGRYNDMTEITSLLQQLTTDMSDYMAQGVLSHEEDCE